MKILWVCNIMLPAYAKEKGYHFSNREGWLSGCFEKLANQETRKSLDIELSVCFPVAADSPIAGGSDEAMGIKFYGFVEDMDHPENYDANLEKRFRQIIDDAKPDVLHVFGTEFPHALAAARAFGRPERTLVGIQGLCSVIAKEYMADIPVEVQQAATFRDRIKNDSIKQQQEKYYKRGENEIELIKYTGNLTGRTLFDREETAKINPAAEYFQINESMRQDFYSGTWNLSDCQEHTIFMSQGDYPLKGLHFMLQALPALIEKYPDTQLYVAGNSILGKIDRTTVSIPDDNSTEYAGSKYPFFMRAASYSKYIKRLIAKKHLNRHVTFLGKLSAAQMKEQLLRCNVYVNASVVENSPNSLGEAMLLGVPCIASRAGGIPTMLKEDVDGLLFDKANVEELVKSIEQLWDESVIASVYGANAKKHAKKTHDSSANFRALMAAYNKIYTK